MTTYIDTSAAAKLAVEEAESIPLLVHLEEMADDDQYPVSSILLDTEMRRLGHRVDIPQTLISELLQRFDLLEPDRALFIDAGLMAGRNLRSLDALHLATAIRSNSTEILTYDERQADAARAAGLAVVTPR